MLYVISVICLSWICEPMPRNQGLFADRARCEIALARVYDNWRPVKGAYAFNCKSYDVY